MLLFERYARPECKGSLHDIEQLVLDEFGYLGLKINMNGTEKDESKVMQGRKTRSALKALVNGKKLNIECTRSSH